MKTVIFGLLITVIFGGFIAAKAQNSRELKLRVGQSKTEARSKIKVKFLAVVEDSRCPEGTNCIWAGNAKIKIQVSKNRMAPKTFELNTNLAEKTVVFEGFEIAFKDLVPYPKAGSQTKPQGYSASIAVTRLSR